VLSTNGRDDRRGETTAHDRDADLEDLSALREVLVGPERERLSELEARLDDPELRARDVGDVLPHVLLQHAEDPHFARALTPPLERALTAAVRRDPKPMADALFPVMGPAIRRAVAAALSGMVESFNRAIEHSLSWRSVQWRLEARRTGRTFGEIVLVKTLVYRVEQMFLIDRRTGLLLQHVQHGAEQVQDADMVSGMLTAIRDFAQDSFKMPDTESLESLEVGGLSVWIEAGPLALVAAVIRGNAPREYRQTLQNAVEEIHLRFGDALRSFSGDASGFADARSLLESCLEMQYRAGERRPRTRAVWALVTIVAIALGAWTGLAYRSERRWTRYLDSLRAQPGLVVVSTGRAGGRYVVTGLRDPLAADPRSFLAAAGLADDAVVGRWAPYQSLDPSIAQTRANAHTDAAIRETIADIESTAILFLKGVARPAADQRPTLDRVIAAVGRLEGLAAGTQTRYGLSLVGHTDADGPPDSNVPLSRARAEAVAAAVAAAVGPQVSIATSGVGSTEPAVPGQTEDANRQNRRVTFRVTAQAR
jgi:outer membrane protein OmpA-like peptidoglycan-associated protein